MFVVKKNNETVAVIDADSFKLDATGESPVLIFTKGDREAVVDTNTGEGTPYWQDAN